MGADALRIEKDTNTSMIFHSISRRGIDRFIGNVEPIFFSNTFLGQVQIHLHTIPRNL